MTKTKAAAGSLKRKIKLDGNWTFVPVAKRGDRYRPDEVVIQGLPTKMKQGTFYLDWREDGKRIQKAVGTNGHEAIEAHRVQTKIHELRVSGVAVEQDAPQLAPGRESMRQRIDHFLEDRRVTLRPKSLKKYSEALTSFLAFTKKRYIEDIKPDDIRGFLAHMTLAEKLAPKTAKVKGRIVHGVLTGLGAALRMERGDWPKVTKKQRRPMYQTVTMQTLLSTVSREHYILWSFFLHTGFREQEVAFCSWSDVDFKRGEISVTEKPHLGFEIKNYQQRTVPVPEELLDLLREHNATLPPNSFLVFPTRAAKGAAASLKPGGKNRLNMLDLLKFDYYLAGLNCGGCEVTAGGKATTCAKVPQCRRVGLHMFRHTFATNLLRAGFNIVDVSRQLGHQDVATTQIYLHDLSNDELREQLNASRMGTMYIPEQFKQTEYKRIHAVSDASRKRMSEGGKRSAQLRAAGID